MDNIVIKVENLSKKYTIGSGQSGSLRETLSGVWHNAFGRKRTAEDFWALKDINLEVKQGEALGIIGRNGAGKSTLLKLLSKITYPTTGKITMNGRVSSLLEVGTGFHPELTGRENIYLNGTILGMSRKEVKAKFDEIVDFSGVEKFLDTPVKRYSSGMYVRLAFAVAAHLEPEILIIDEVLSVGDAEFQKKCLGKMDEVAKGGRTVIFVSHNMTAIKNLCNNGILLSEGKILSVGKMQDVINKYIGNYQKNNEIKKTWGTNRPKGENVSLIEAELITNNNFSISEEIFISFIFEIAIDMKSFNASLVLYTVENEPIFNSWSNLYDLKKGKHKAVMKIPSNFLNTNIYKVQILFVNYSKAIFNLQDVLHFEAKENDDREIGWYGDVIGVVRPKFEWTLK